MASSAVALPFPDSCDEASRTTKLLTRSTTSTIGSSLESTHIGLSGWNSFYSSCGTRFKRGSVLELLDSNIDRKFKGVKARRGSNPVMFSPPSSREGSPAAVLVPELSSDITIGSSGSALPAPTKISQANSWPPHSTVVEIPDAGLGWLDGAVDPHLWESASGITPTELMEFDFGLNLCLDGVDCVVPDTADLDYMDCMLYPSNTHLSLLEDASADDHADGKTPALYLPPTPTTPDLSKSKIETRKRKRDTQPPTPPSTKYSHVPSTPPRPRQSKKAPKVSSLKKARVSKMSSSSPKKSVTPIHNDLELVAFFQAVEIDSRSDAKAGPHHPENWVPPCRRRKVPFSK